MYEFHDNTQGFEHEESFDLEAGLPEPLEHWTLRDFADILSIVSYAS